MSKEPSMAKPASRIEQIPPYLFARIDKKKAEVREKGMDLVDFGIGDPDIPTPANIIAAMKKAVDDPKNHRYPSYEGMPEFRQAAAAWYKRRFGVDLNPDTEVVTLIGSKEGIAHIPWAYAEPGDVVLCPSPGYPVYKIATIFAGATPYIMPLKEENGFLPIYEDIPDDSFYEKTLELAKKYNILICHDAAYSEIAYDGYRPKSILEFDRDKKYSLEFHSLSKTYCMTGWRIGFAVGNADGIYNLGKLKTNIDSGAFQAVQYAGIEALTGDQTSVAELNARLEKRRDAAVEAFKTLGVDIKGPKATYYIWAKVPKGFTSSDFCEKLIEETGIVVTPGSGFGDEGEGYFRISITLGEEKIAEAARRLKAFKL
jgi:LL-diaminopimelate aminotransferase